MSTLAVTRRQDEVVAAATAGNESAFAELVDRYRRGVQAHCYRILGSYEESEDVTQETFLRAWRSRESFRGGAPFGAWLYRIATNVCLTALRRRHRPATAPGLESRRARPYGLEAIATTESEPGDEVVLKETMELAFRHLPPRQRAVVFLCDVLGWSARDAAELLETSAPAVRSALQRARTRLAAHLPERRLEPGPVSSAAPSRPFVREAIV